MAWFNRKEKNISSEKNKKDIPSGLWVKCPSCSEIQYKPELEKNNLVCRKCEHHFRVKPSLYYDLLLDQGTGKQLFTNIESSDPLTFKAEKEYIDQLSIAKAKTNQNDAINCYLGSINNHELILSVMNFEFIGGAHGQNESEAIIFAAEYATKNQTPLILMPCGGGQVMFQGARALVGMTRTTVAVSEFKKNTNLPYIVVFHYKCAGGITASYAHLSEIAIAENENSEIIFAGRRVIEGTIKEELPSNFQKASWALEKGFIDNIIDRKDLPEKLGSLLSILLNKKSQVSSENNEQTSESNITTREAS